MVRMGQEQKEVRQDLQKEKQAIEKNTAAVLKTAEAGKKEADLAIKREDWNTAKLNLKIALGHDPESDIIQAKIALVEEKIAARKRR